MLVFSAYCLEQFTLARLIVAFDCRVHRRSLNPHLYNKREFIFTEYSGTIDLPIPNSGSVRRPRTGKQKSRRESLPAQ